MPSIVLKIINGELGPNEHLKSDRDFLDEQYRMLRETVLEKGSFPLQLFFAESPSQNKKFLLVNDRLDNEEYITAVAGVVREFMRDQDVTRVVLLSEVWWAQVSDEESQEVLSGNKRVDELEPPQDRPDRREAVVAVLFKKGETDVTMLGDITRNAAGDIVDIPAQPALKQMSEAAGRFVRLLG